MFDFVLAVDTGDGTRIEASLRNINLALNTVAIEPSGFDGGSTDASDRCLSFFLKQPLGVLKHSLVHFASRASLFL